MFPRWLWDAVAIVLNLVTVVCVALSASSVLAAAAAASDWESVALQSGVVLMVVSACALFSFLMGRRFERSRLGPPRVIQTSNDTVRVEFGRTPGDLSVELRLSAGLPDELPYRSMPLNHERLN